MLPPEFIEKCHTPFCLVSQKGEILWCNEQFRNLFPGRDVSAFTLEELFLDPELASLIKQTPCERECALGYGDSRVIYSLNSTRVEGTLDSPSSILIALHRASETKERRHRQEFGIQAIAHDLANPVSAIFGYADLLLDNSQDDELSQSQLEILRKIRGTAARAIEMVKNYQILSQVDHHGLSLPSSHAELNKVVQDVIEYAWREGPDVPGLDMRLNRAPVEIAAPRFAAERIFANLLTNAMKYGDAAGRIEVTTSKSAKAGVLSVWNSGNPIPQNEIPTVFEKYTRGAGAREVAGVGVGLYIVKTLAERAGASVDVSSSTETGTTFTVSFPLG